MAWNLFAVVAALCRQLADGEHQPRHESVFSARDFSVLRGVRLAGGFRRVVGDPDRDDAVYRIAPGVGAAVLPVVLIVQLAFTAGVSLLLAMGNLFFRDIKYLFEVVLMLWMFASAVLYPVEPGRRPARRGPAVQPDDADHRGVPLGAAPATSGRPPGPFAAAAVLAFLTLAVGWVWFHRAEFQFAESV